MPSRYVSRRERVLGLGGGGGGDGNRQQDKRVPDRFHGFGFSGVEQEVTEVTAFSDFTPLSLFPPVAFSWLIFQFAYCLAGEFAGRPL